MAGRPRLLVIVLIAVAFLFENCVTVPASAQKIPVTSNPAGAKVFVDGKAQGTAPLLLRLDRSIGHVVRIEAEGYQPVEISVPSGAQGSPSVESHKVGDIVWGFVVGAAVGALVGNERGKSEGEGSGNPLYILPGLVVGGGIGGLAGGLVSWRSTPKRSAPYVINITLEKIGGKPGPGYIVLKSNDLNGIRWIQVRCSDSGAGGLK